MLPSYILVAPVAQLTLATYTSAGYMCPADCVKPTDTAPLVRPRTRSISDDASPGTADQAKQNSGVALASLHQLCHDGGGSGGGGAHVPASTQPSGGGLGGGRGLGGGGEGEGGGGRGGGDGGGEGRGTKTSVT